jgi:hypothetical protein
MESDFDFIFGDWIVKHQRLKERLKGSRDWEEFDGRCRATPLLGGHGNVDDNFVNIPGGAYRAISLRSFDAVQRLWAIWWLDGRRPHSLDVPVVGQFENGVGVFFADDQFEGVAIRVKFLWTGTNTPAPQWEQSFSVDGGKNWEVNWLMSFHRLHEGPKA